MSVWSFIITGILLVVYAIDVIISRKKGTVNYKKRQILDFITVLIFTCQIFLVPNDYLGYVLFFDLAWCAIFLVDYKELKKNK